MANLIYEYNLQTKKIEELMLKQSLQASKTHVSPVKDKSSEYRRSARIATKAKISYLEPELEKRKRLRIRVKKEEVPNQPKDSPKETKIPSPIKEKPHHYIPAPAPKMKISQEIKYDVDPTYRPALHICDQCGLSYVQKGSLTFHQKQKKHRQGETIFQSYSQDTNQEEEIEQPKRIKSQFECSECGQIYTQTSSLYLHQRKKHKGINFNREVFRTRTRRREEYNKSEKSQRIKKYGHLIRDYDCEICGNSYTQQSSLNLHKRLKHNNKIQQKMTRSVVRLVNEKPYYEDEDSKLNVKAINPDQRPGDEVTSLKQQE